MKKLLTAILMSSIFAGCLFGQTSELSVLQQRYRNFDYDGVIELANELLTRADQFTSEQLVQIYEMKAMSHYSKSDLDAAEFSFVSILKLDANYSPDPVKTSPKIITFFDSIKLRYENQTQTPHEQKIEKIIQPDTVTIIVEKLGAYQKSIPASLILPGTGHLLMGDTKRGAILTGISVLTLSSAIYFTGQTRQKEKEYLNTTKDEDMALYYNSYNSAFKTRNALWIAYAAAWLYTQTDLIFFHQGRAQLHVAAHPSIHKNTPSFISLSFAF